MKKFTAVVAAVAALMVASSARAAAVDLTFTKQADGTTWQLAMDIAAGGPSGIAQVAFIVNGQAGINFAITAPSSVVDTFTSDTPSGFSAKLISGGSMHLSMVPGSAGSMGGPGTHLVIGNLTGGLGLVGCDNAGCGSQFVRGDTAGDGGTILDLGFNGLDEATVGVHFVPEPGALLLLALGMGGLGLIRRKA